MLDAGYRRGGNRYTPQNLHWFNHAGVIVSSYTCRNGSGRRDIPSPRGTALPLWCTARSGRRRRRIRYLSNSALRPSCIARNGTHHRHIPGWNSSGHRWPVGFRTVRVPRMSRRASRLVDPVMRRRLTHPTAEGPAARRRRARRGSCPTGWMHGSRIVMDGQTRQHLLKC